MLTALVLCAVITADADAQKTFDNLSQSQKRRVYSAYRKAGENADLQRIADSRKLPVETVRMVVDEYLAKQKPSRRQRSRKKSGGQGSGKPGVRLFGRKEKVEIDGVVIPIEAFKRKARPATPAQLVAIPPLKPIKVQAEVESVLNNGAVLQPLLNGKPHGGQMIIVDDGSTRELRNLKKGAKVHAWVFSPLTEEQRDSVRDRSSRIDRLVYLVAWEPLTPGLRWQIKLRNAGAIVAGKRQTFYVDGFAQNTGEVTFRSVTLEVRLYQISSPNDWTKKVTLRNLKPKAREKFTTKFEIYNFQYIGGTSVPKVEVRLVGWRD